MDPVQYYETTIYNRETGQAFAIATMPARSLLEKVVPSISVLGKRWDTPGTVIRPLEVWSLPFLIDFTLGDRRGFGPLTEPPYAWPLPLRPSDRRWSSPFAEHLAYAPVVPMESSPLASRSLSSLVTTAGGAVGAYLTKDPLLLLTVPAGIIVCRASLHVGDGIGIVLRTWILSWAGVEDVTPEPEDEERGE